MADHTVVERPDCRASCFHAQEWEYTMEKTPDAGCEHAATEAKRCLHVPKVAFANGFWMFCKSFHFGLRNVLLKQLYQNLVKMNL